MPQLGETVTEGTITKWFKGIGDQVARDEPLFEVSTDKVDSEVPSPAEGVLSAILVEEGDTVDVGVKLAEITDGASSNGHSAAPEAAAPVDRRDGSLQQQVTSCSWTMWLGGMTEGALAERVAALLAADSVPITRERKGRQDQDDLRPSVLALGLAGNAGRELDRDLDPGTDGAPLAVVAELACQPRGVRPIELVRGLIAVSGRQAGHGVEDAPAGDGSGAGVPVLDRACRTQQWIERDGRREEPLGRRGATAGADRAVHALERAS